MYSNVNYALAKMLKDAGFPYTTGNFRSVYPPDEPVPKYYMQVIPEDDKGVRLPTLSELIEACGQCLSHIKRLRVNDYDYWWAVSHCGHPEHEWSGNNLEKQGKTPEEAVAKLWIALNNK